MFLLCYYRCQSFYRGKDRQIGEHFTPSSKTAKVQTGHSPTPTRRCVENVCLLLRVDLWVDVLKVKIVYLLLLFIMFTVGMKLSLLDPKLPIDLQYLGVHLPHPPPIHEGSDKMNPTSLSSSPGV